ncbi:leukotoxin LktA family filamentous adhesin [uncultured Oxalicibacterium sp.]|uniref:leukotoxin LktA family filamentous adhesin n=1 Tax=uncultured Oxalicibacterium sp. TaxID=1168540 RepID=UPI0025EFBD15|nr:leukotoxin LktA family filamentous adhesin [uncultured Oxalicibacterium sp.]
MNRIYNIVWNRAKGLWQVAGENARSCGKSKSVKLTDGAGILLMGSLLSGAGPAAFAQNIVTDGRTNTTLTQTGNVTDVRTNTIQGGVGFNSFSRFSVAGGDVANLYVPDAANALVNVVRDQRSEINGILNSYKQGKIGGDVYFVNPHGMVVGQSGVLNVGSLTISTPTQAFAEQLIGQGGQISAQAVAQLMAGNIPLSSSGLVAIRGQVNATNAVTVSAQSVEVSTSGQIIAGRQAVPRIAQLVNTQGLSGGVALAEGDGTIRIVAAEDVTIAGQVRADGMSGQAAGTVDIRAGVDIRLADSAQVSASGRGAHSDGGSVVIKAAQTTRLDKGGVVAANAGASGDGGFVELSADKSVTWGGSLQANAGAGGKAGQVLIDPENIDIVEDQRLGGANYTLQASNTINIADGVMVSTRNIANYQTATQQQHRDAVSIGDSGNITLEAPTIVVGEDAKLYAHTNTSSYQAGNITLKAVATEGALITPGVQVGVGSNKTEITLKQGAELRGKQVTITAESSTALTHSLSEQGLYNSYDAQGNPIAEVLTDEQMETQRQSLLASGAITEGQASTGQKGFFNDMMDTLLSNGLLAGVQVLDAQAKINIGDRVTIIGSNDVNIAAHASTNATAAVTGLHIGAVVSVTNTDAQLNVGQNAHIESLNGDVKLKSQSDSIVQTEVEAMQVSSKMPVTLTANISYTQGNANTTVGSGSLIKAAQDGSITAEQNKTFAVAATAGDSDGSIGVAVLVAISDLNANTDFNGTLQSGRDANLGAAVNTLQNQHEASVLLGDNLGSRVAKFKDDATDKLMEGVKSLLGKTTKKGEESGGDEQSSGFLKKIGLAGAVAYIDHDNQAGLNVGSQAKVKAGRDANLEVQVTDALNSTVSTEVSDKKTTDKPFSFNTENTEKKNGASVAILISSQNNSAVLTVRPGAELDAARNLTMFAKASLPWLDQSRLSNLIKSFSSDNLDDFIETVTSGDQIFSTWVDAATAVSGDGAKDDGTTLSGMVDINNMGLSAKIDVADGVKINQDTTYRGQKQTVNINALTEAQMVNVAADPGVFNSSGGKNGMGAGVIVGTYKNTAEATVGAVNLYANELNVSAVTDVDMVNYAVAGSKGGTNALSGSVAVSMLQNVTRAGIDDGANLVLSNSNGGSGNLSISARDETDSLTITGGVVKSSTRAAGAAAGVHDFDRETEAWLGNRDTNLAAGNAVIAGDLNVGAGSGGLIGNYALSVAMTAPPTPEEQASSQSREGTGAFGINVSGSAAVNLIKNRVSARVTDDLALQAVNVNVDARDDTGLHAIAGGAAVSSNTGSGVGLAGAYTQNTVDARVEAELAATGTVAAQRIDIVADNEADILSISAGVSASASTGSYQVAGSVSVNAIDSVTRARLADGAISADQAVNVSASDDSSIVAVGGAVTKGGKAGIGAGLSINHITGSTEAVAENLSSLHTNGGLSLNAKSEGELVSAAAAMGYSNKYAFDGAVAINEVEHTTRAAIVDSSNIDVTGDVQVKAENDSTIQTISGAVAAGSSAMGASFGYNTIADKVSAEVLYSQARAANVRIDADQNAHIDALVAGGAAGTQGSAVAGSVAINIIDNETSARSVGAQLTATSGAINIDADDTSRIRSLTGALAYGGQGAGIGIAGSYNDIGGQIYAGAQGGSLSAANGSINVTAERDQELQTLAAGAGGGGKVGVAGSVAVNTVTGSTLAEMTSGVVADAKNNILVDATSDSSIQTIAGALGVGLGSVGLAGSVAVNQLDGTTVAQVTGSNTFLTARGQGSALAGSGVRGVAVTAESTDTIKTFAVSVGAGSSVGVAGAVTVNMMGGATRAEIDGAKLNNSVNSVAAGAAAEQGVLVKAKHDASLTSGNGAGAGGGTAGVGVSVGTNIISHDTSARVRNAANVAAAGNVAMQADGHNDIDVVVVGAAIGGTAGVNGSVAVTTLEGSVIAGVDGSALTGAAIDVNAKADNDLDIIAGGVAGGGTAGVGATVIVTTLNQQTNAYTQGASVLNATGQTRIQAAASQDVNVVGMTGAGGGTAGVAGTVNVLVASGQTKAAIGAGSKVNDQATGATQDVLVDADDKIDTRSTLGTLGVGGTAGVGAGADIQVIRSGAIAEVGQNANVKAGRDIKVTADNQRDINSLSVAAAGGGFVGAGAGISVVSVASGASSDASSSLDSSLSNAQSVGRNSGLNGQLGNDYSGSQGLQSSINSKQQQVSPNTAFNTAPDQTSYSAAAKVGAGAVLTAGRDILVGAANRTDISSKGVGVAAGLAGAGGGVAIVNAGDRTLAELAGTINAGRNVTLSAKDGQSGETQVTAGAGGGGLLGLGAAVAVAEKSSTAVAHISDGTQITAGQDLSVNADLQHALSAETIGVSVGGVAVGASVATAKTQGQSSAELGQNVIVQANNIQINSHAASRNDVEAIGVSGGIVAGNAVVATASDRTAARSWVGAGSRLTATGDIGLQASTDPMARAFSFGAAIGAGAVGASVAVASVDTQVTAGADGATLTAGDDLTVSAEARRSAQESAEARAVGASGGVLAGLNATVANATVRSDVLTQLGQGSVLVVGDEATIKASDATSVKTDATGIAVGGLLAVGANIGNASIDANQRVRFGSSGVVAGTLTLSATGNNKVTGDAVAGSGGVIAGSASTLSLNADSTTTVDMLSSTDIMTGRSDVVSEHRFDYAGDSSSLQASMVGASGTFINVDLASDTRVNVGAGAKLKAEDGIDIEAHSDTRGGATAYSGSGGVFSGSAVLVDNVLRDASRIIIGDGALIGTFGSPLNIDKGHVRMTAHNTMRVSDTGRLSAGGAIAAPYAGTEMDVDVTNEVLVGNNVALRSSGLLQVGAYSDTRAATNARVDVYGLVGAGGGESKIDLVANQLVRLGNNVDVLGYGSVGLRAGQSADGSLANDIRAVGSTVVVNNTLIPVTAVLDADATVNTTNNLILGSGDRVRSVRNVDLVADNGNVTADGNGVGKNPYLSLFSSEQTMRSNRVNRQATVKLANSQIVAGAGNRQEVYWDGTTLRTVSSLDDLQVKFVPVGQTATYYQPLADLDLQLAAKRAQLEPLVPGSSAYNTLNTEILALQNQRDSTALTLGVAPNGKAIVDTLEVKDLIAGSGDIRVGADHIQQSGANLTAYGAPTVIIHNSSDDYLVTNGILVSAAGSGSITSIGAAKVASSGATLTEVKRSQSDYYDATQRPSVPSIVIENTYDTNLPGNTGIAPNLLLLGDIENLKGNTAISNLSGNVSQFGTIESYQLSMNVPNGDLYVSLPGRSWNLASVQAEWAALIASLDPTNASGRNTPDSIAEFAANVYYNRDFTFTTKEDFTDYLIRNYGVGNGKDQQVILKGLERGYWESTSDNTSNRIWNKGTIYQYSGNQSASDHNWLTNNTGVWDWTYTMIKALKTQNSATLSQSDTSGSSQSALRVGGALAINAKNININAGIEVGARTDWSLNLGGAAATEIASIANGNGLVRLNNVTAIADGNGLDDVPVVYWDSNNQRIQVQRINASGGGSVSLTGNIINTNTLGNIVVNSGYGDVQINNTTGRDMMLTDIDLGKGGQSVVRITDTLKTWGDGRAQTWWYVNQAGQDSVSVYNNANGATALDSASLSGTSGRDFVYNPQAGARYEWTQNYHITRAYKGSTAVDGEYGDIPENLGNWVSQIATSDQKAYTTSAGDVVVRAVTGNDKAFMQWANADIQHTTVNVTSNGGGWGGYYAGTTFDLATDIKMTVTNSVKADQAIPIRFVGNTQSKLQVDANSNVLVGGVLRNDVGTTRFDITGALLNAGGSVQAMDLQLNALGGIGRADSALNIIDTRLAGAAVSASSQGNIYLNTDGNLYAKSIQTTGDVTVNAVGGIYQHADATGASISGDVLNLHSGSGSSIGSSTQALVTQSNEINASAPGSVTLTQATGHMNVGLIESRAGDVVLNTPTGQILGAAPKGADHDAQQQEKIALWESMGLTDSTHAASTVNGYENRVERYYGDYWNIRQVANNPDGNFSLTTAGLSLFRAQISAVLGHAATDAEINTVISARYQEAKAFLNGTPGLSSTLLTQRADNFQYTLDTGSTLYAEMTHGAVWSKAMLGTSINAGAEAGTRPSTGALPNVSATNGTIRLNNDPTQPLPASATLVFTIKRTNGYDPVVTQLSASDDKTYASNDLLAFLSAAKPGTMVAEQVDGDTMKVTLKPRNDLVVEARDPVVIDAVGDYHVSTSQDVILKDITVGGTLYVYAGRDVVNQTATGIAGARTGGLYIDAGRNIGAPDNPIQVTNNGNNPVTIYRLVAPGTADVVVLEGDVVLGKLEVAGTTNVTANRGNFSSLGDHTLLNGGLVNLRAVDANGNTSGYIGTLADPFDVVQQSGSLGLFGLGATVTAKEGDLTMANSTLDGATRLKSDVGAIRMADANAVIRTTDETDGEVDLVAATGIGENGVAMRLDTGRFNAETPEGDVHLHLHREAKAERVHALDGSAYIVGDGDGNLASIDLDLNDVRVARDLGLQAETIRANVTQTKQTTPLRVWATGVNGLAADQITMKVAGAPYVRFEDLASRQADLRTNANRVNVAKGYIAEEMNLTTAFLTALMDNTTPKLRYTHDLQYYIPPGKFAMDLTYMGADSSHAPMWFDARRGVYTRSFVTSGNAAFDLARSQFNRDFKAEPGRSDGTPLALSTMQWKSVLPEFKSNLTSGNVSVNLDKESSAHAD